MHIRLVDADKNKATCKMANSKSSTLIHASSYTQQPDALLLTISDLHHREALICGIQESNLPLEGSSDTPPPPNWCHSSNSLFGIDATDRSTRCLGQTLWWMPHLTEVTCLV